ncbi:MAG: TonB-system energizer ExbB [Spirochaetes bacterium]|nr:TonB-system energizer ExbB [Spirochaetota bacterium]
MNWLKEIVEYGMMGLLGAMSFFAVALAVERYLTLRKVCIAEFSSKKELELTLTQRMHFLASIASNAPYIGLLGTVLGIMLTFYTMGAEGVVDSNRIMIGLALAMKVTALGLVVAIPTSFVYNLLLRRIKTLLTRWDIRIEALVRKPRKPSVNKG